MNRKLDNLPRTPLQFYVKLYCNKKKIFSSESRNAVIEATKSWLSLSTQEKLKITKKFKDSNANYKNKFANYLKSAEPYLKKKKGRSYLESHRTNEVQDTCEQEPTLSLTLQTTNDECVTPAPNASIKSITTDIDDIPTKTESKIAIQDEPADIEQQISEPNPPNIKNAQQLYDIINTSDARPNWNLLTKLEKSRYQKAVLMLKKNYINKYKQYLESLPSKELFNYYNKNID